MLSPIDIIITDTDSPNFDSSQLPTSQSHDLEPDRDLNHDSKKAIDLLKQNLNEDLLDLNEKFTFISRDYNRWAPLDEGVTLVWRDLNVFASVGHNRFHKRIINNVTGAVRAGSFVAILGGSGAGKSTLMHTLAFRNCGNQTVDGDILLNGRHLGKYMYKLSGFMHQHDLFVGSLTVFEHMLFMAHLKLKNKLTISEKLSRIRGLLHDLGLNHCAHKTIGSNGADEKVLSGGEKKRLSFATEMLTNPAILFCDEPTTGLDSYSAQKLVSMMRVMAAKGKTVICTIHQPSSELFAMFDNIILIADGRLAFMGTTNQAFHFFDTQGYQCPLNFNPADFFVNSLAIAPGNERASRLAIRKICDQFSVSDAAKEIDMIVQYEFHMGGTMQEDSYGKNDDSGNSWLSQLYWITYRSFLEVKRDPSIQIFRIFQKIAIALMVGLCYFGTVTSSQMGVQSVQGALFILVSENTFTPMYSVMGLFPREFPLFIREYKSGLYSTGVYYLSKMIAVLPGLLFEPLLFTCIMYWMVGLKATAFAFLMTSLMAILTMIVSTSCGIFFSLAFDTVPLSMAILVPFDYVLMISSGNFIQLNTMPGYAAWTKYLSWLMYSNEALSIIQWEGVTNITCTSNATPCLTTGQEILEKYSFSQTHLYPNIWAMAAWYCIYTILGFVFLFRKARKY